MKEEKDILNRDVEIPEVVFRKADAALNQIRANTGSTKATSFRAVSGIAS